MHFPFPKQAFPALALMMALFQPVFAQSPPPKIGIVIMHGKGGLPGGFVGPLASSLESRGFLIANLEMPWSKRRDYDASVAAAEMQVEAAFDSLRAKGAAKLFVAGHSQGGLFALYFGDRHVFDGLISIAPGANVGSPVFKEKLGDMVEQARQLVAEGKGDDKARFADYEFSKGTYPITTTPRMYLDWFAPEGAMNEVIAIKNLNPRIPVLFIAPKGDYPGLQKVKQQMFGLLPANPLTVLHEPDGNHGSAPAASADEIARWVTAVSTQATQAQ